jgi:hypothetical protein
MSFAGPSMAADEGLDFPDLGEREIDRGEG